MIFRRALESYPLIRVADHAFSKHDQTEKSPPIWSLNCRNVSAWFQLHGSLKLVVGSGCVEQPLEYVAFVFLSLCWHPKSDCIVVVCCLMQGGFLGTLPSTHAKSLLLSDSFAPMIPCIIISEADTIEAARRRSCASAKGMPKRGNFKKSFSLHLLNHRAITRAGEHAELVRH